jgi:hypothetical protein
VLLQRKFLL